MKNSIKQAFKFVEDSNEKEGAHHTPRLMTIEAGPRQEASELLDYQIGVG
jgi:hypothetical protein